MLLPLIVMDLSQLEVSYDSLPISSIFLSSDLETDTNSRSKFLFVSTQVGKTLLPIFDLFFKNSKSNK